MILKVEVVLRGDHLLEEEEMVQEEDQLHRT
jgi:hypothetical protein